MIFDESNRLVSLKTPHLDTQDTKIDLKTPTFFENMFPHHIY